MNISIPHNDLPILNETVKRFLYKDSEVSFIPFQADFSKLEEVINKKKESYPNKNRDTLVKALEEQYIFLSEKEKASSTVWKNIQLLREKNTYTLTTGQQIHIFLGPLYVPHKIETVIALAEKLKIESPSNNFIPIFWMASEDHDFEEISTLKLWGKEFKWQKESNGPTGRLETQSLSKIIEEIENTFNLKDSEKETLKIFADIYSNAENLSDATKKIVHHFWGEKGIVCLDADNKELKSLIKDVFRVEIENAVSYNAVSNCNNKLKENNTPLQINPRDTALFLLSDKERERIDRQEDGDFVLNPSNKTISKQALLDICEKNPEAFSPNVSLRPIYQERILPNLAYIGGAGEMMYWFQLSELFSVLETPLPILFLRKIGVYIGNKQIKQWEEMELELSSLFLSTDKFENYISSKLGIEKKKTQIKSELNQILQKLQDLTYEIKPQAVKEIKQTLKEWTKEIDTHFEKLTFEVEILNKKQFTKAKKIHQNSMPNGHLQEREQHFLEYMYKHAFFVDNHNCNYVDNSNIFVFNI